MIIHYDKYPFNLKHILIKSKKVKKGDRPLFSGTVPFSPFVEEDRDCPSPFKKGACPLFLSFQIELDSIIKKCII